MKNYDWRKETNYDGFVGCVYILASWLALGMLAGILWIIVELIKRGL
jgi:hypothetical protein